MGARTQPSGYGWIAKALHWLVVLAVAAQFVVGYTLDADDRGGGRGCDPVGERRSGGDTTEAEEDRLDRLEEACEAAEDRADAGDDDKIDISDPLVRTHVLLGVLILALAVLRIVRRRVDGLPDWSEHLSPLQRRVASVTERVLLVLLFVVPLSGFALLAGGDDALALHVAAHLAFFVALAVHLSSNLRPRVLARMV